MIVACKVFKYLTLIFQALMEQNVFPFLLTTEGSAEKVFTLIMALKSIYNNNFGFVEQICTFKSYKEVQINKN